MIWKDAKYVLGNMWETKFQERSSKNHVIHKVNFMVITKVKRLVLPNMLQSEQELHIWNPCQVAYPSTPVFMNIGSLVPEIWGFKGWQPCPFLPKLSKFGGGGHISHTTGPIDLKFWIWCCGFPNNMYTKFHWNLRRSGLTHWVIWHRMTL